jgi:hypothetical protein
MYRHLAHWPAYLALVWTMLAPLEIDRRLDRAIEGSIAKARPGSVPCWTIADIAAGDPASHSASGYASNRQVYR